MRINFALVTISYKPALHGKMKQPWRFLVISRIDRSFAKEVFIFPFNGTEYLDIPKTNAIRYGFARKIDKANKAISILAIL